MIPYNKSLVANAQNLRKNMTPEEKHLWYDFLKRLPLTVKRQHIIGNYIVDFYIANKKLVVEVDGDQHLESEHRKADEARDSELGKWGITVLRYSNHHIRKYFDFVARDILKNLELDFSDLKPCKTPHPPQSGPPSPTGEGHIKARPGWGLRFVYLLSDFSGSFFILWINIRCLPQQPRCNRIQDRRCCSRESDSHPCRYPYRWERWEAGRLRGCTGTDR